MAFNEQAKYHGPVKGREVFRCEPFPALSWLGNDIVRERRRRARIIGNPEV